MDEGAPTQNRGSRRSAVFFAGVIEAFGWIIPVKLLNFSAKGALIEAEELPPVDSDVLFRRNDLAAKGCVAWRTNGRAGIEFEKELDAQQMIRSVASPKATMCTVVRRPGFSSSLSENERRLGEQWFPGAFDRSAD